MNKVEIGILSHRASTLFWLQYAEESTDPTRYKRPGQQSSACAGTDQPPTRIQGLASNNARLFSDWGRPNRSVQYKAFSPPKTDSPHLHLRPYPSPPTNLSYAIDTCSAHLVNLSQTDSRFRHLPWSGAMNYLGWQC